MMTSDKPAHLYLHVPFCRSICYYCDFCHSIYQEKKAAQWLKAVAQEIHARKISDHLLTIYIGGGTPTALSSEELDQLLSLLDPYCMHAVEYTIEINPETLNEEKAQILRKHQVNRASIGLETSSIELLRKMNRHHTIADVKRSMDLLHQNQINNISLDLMYSLPDETMQMLQADIKAAVSLHPEHLSLYCLEIHENTVFGKKNMHTCNEDTEADMYEFICHELPLKGYQQYEISNFALAGKQSKHNLGYWNYEDFYGIGMGASGKEGMIRYEHTSSFQQYVEHPLKQRNILLTETDAMFEEVMMGMRLKQGMDCARFAKKWGRSVEEVYPDVIQHLRKEKLIEEREDRLVATTRGYEILNDVLEEFLP